MHRGITAGTARHSLAQLGAHGASPRLTPGCSSPAGIHKSWSGASTPSPSLSEDAISPKVKHLRKCTDFDEIAFGKKNQRRKSFR